MRLQTRCSAFPCTHYQTHRFKTQRKCWSPGIYQLVVAFFMKRRPAANIAVGCSSSNATCVRQVHTEFRRNSLIFPLYTWRRGRLQALGCWQHDLPEKLGDDDPSRSEPDLFQWNPCLSLWARRQIANTRLSVGPSRSQNRGNNRPRPSDDRSRLITSRPLPRVQGQPWTNLVFKDFWNSQHRVARCPRRCVSPTPVSRRTDRLKNKAVVRSEPCK